MTCARREAGARKPAHSAGSPSRPDPRPGRSRARFSLFLPALALLLGALSPFAAAPAAADVLVSNLGQTRGTTFSTDGFITAQGFRTGSAGAGYTLSSIETVIESNPTDAQRQTIRAELWTAATGGGPSATDKVVLTVPSSVSAGTVSFAAPTGTVLSANTTYFFLAYTTGGYNLAQDVVRSGNEDSGGQTGWSILDAYHWQSGNLPGSSWSRSTSTSTAPIRVNGEAKSTTTPTPTAAPGPPVGLAVTPGATKLELDWTAPEGAASYDVHYTSSTTVAPDAASGHDPANAWVDVHHLGTSPSMSITSLTNDTPYRVRVRGVNAVGDGAWAWGTGTPKATTSGSTDASLSGLVLADGSGDALSFGTFSSTTYAYAASVLADTAAVKVTPTVNQSNATVKVNGATVASGSASGAIDLAYGANRIMVEVTAQAGNTRNYAITVTRALPVVNFSTVEGAYPVPEGTSEFPLTLLSNAENDMSGTLLYADGTATIADDVGTPPTMWTASVGNFPIDLIFFSIAEDTLNEEDETFTVTIEPGTGYTVGSPATATILITDNDPPAPPGSLSLKAGNGALTATWTKPAGPVTGYQLRWKETAATDQDATTAGDPSTGWVEGDEVSSLTASAGSLTNGTGYDVQVRATDGQTAAGNGFGPWSATQAGTPAAKTWRLNPSDFTATEGATASPRIVLSEPAPAGGLTWTLTPLFGDDVPTNRCQDYTGRAEAADLVANPPTTITLNAGETSGDVRYQSARDAIHDESAECLAVRFTPAQAVIDAGWTLGAPLNEDHVPDVSEIVIFNVLPPPAMPTDLRITASNGQLDLAWTAPSGTVTGYDVHYTSSPNVHRDATVGGNTDASTGWVDAGHTGTTASQSITGLTNDTQYRLRVRAVNAATGSSGWLRGAFAPQRRGVGVPTNLQAHSANAAVELTWGAPSMHPDLVTRYDVHYTSAPSTFAPRTGQNAIDDQAAASGSDPSVAWVAVSRTEADPPVRSQTITGLANGTDYRFRVRAVNVDRPGAWGFAEARPVALAGPADFYAVPGDGRLLLSWSAQQFAGTRVRYALDYTSAAEGDVANGAPASGADPAAAWVGVSDAIAGTSHTLGSLTNGTAYRVRLRATRTGEEGPWGFAAGTPAAGGAIYAVTLSAAPNPVAEGASVTVTATVSSPITGAPEARIPLTVTDGTAEPADRGTATEIRIRRNEVSNTVLITTAHDADSDDETFTVAIDADNLPSALVAVNPSSVEIEIRDDEGSSPLPAMHSQVCPQSGRVWSATMIAGDGRVGTTGSARAFGYSRSATTIPDMGTLTRARFVYRNGTVYGIERIIRTVGTDPVVAGHDPLVLVLDKAYTDAVAATLALHAGGRVFRFADAKQSADKRSLTWNDAGMDWMANGQVALCLTDTAVTLSYNDPVYEGQDLRLTATVPHPLTDAVTIPVHITDSLTYQETTLDDGFPGITIPANASSGTGTILMPHDDDTVTESWRVRLGNLPAPLVAGDPNPLYVTVYDDDEPAAPAPEPVDSRPAAGLAGPAQPVPEGSPVGVSLMLSSALDSDVTIPLTVTRGTSEAGDHGTLPGITIPAGQCCATALIETVADADGDAETFTVALDADNLPAEVRLGDPVSVAVTIADNGVVRRQGDGGGGQTPVPVVTIAGGWPVTEGTAAGFTLRAAPAPAADLGVTVTVSESGAFVQASALGARTVTIPAGAASAAFTVATEDDAAGEPSGTVMAALASGDGYTVGGASRARVAVNDDDALPGIVTKQAKAREGSDDVVRFFVRLDRAAPSTVTVDYATADGAGRWERLAPATAGADYTAVSGTLTFAPGQMLEFVEVPLLDDAINEGTEYFLLRFSNPQGATLAAGETQGLIRNDDHLQAMWLARFGRTVGTQMTDAVSERLQGGLAPGAHATLAGQGVDLAKADDGKALAEVMTGLAQTFGAPSGPANDDDPFAHHNLADPWNDPATATAARSVTGRELLLGSSFHVAGTGEGSGPALAAWGRVAQAGFDGEHADDTGRTGVDGTVLTGVLGADAEWNRLLAGVAISLSEGEGSFDSPGADVGKSGDIESTMTVVSPYARFRVTERITAWGLAGWGTGDMTIRFDDGSMAPVRTDLSMQLGAIGARGALLTQDEAGGMDLALKADAFFVRTESEKAVNSAETQADASRVRLVLEGGRAFVVGNGATLRPSLELGLRHDGGDAETGTGVELGGGVSYSDPDSGLSIEAKARMLLAHADTDYKEWGASATARLDPGERGRGLSFSLSPTIGASSSAAERLWGARDARALAPDGAAFEAARGLQGEMGYGLSLGGDRFTGTPNLGFGMSDGGARDWRIGWRLTSAVPGDPGFEISLDATRNEPANDNGPVEHGVMLRSLIRW